MRFQIYKKYDTMNTNNKTIFSILILLSFLIVSCDPAVEYDKIVQNNSDYDVQVLRGIGYWYLNGTDTVYTPIDTLTVKKNSSRVIFHELGIGSVYDYQDCQLFIDSMPLLVYYSDSIKIIPNIHKMNHWDYNIIKKYKNRGGVCECRMILTNEILTE